MDRGDILTLASIRQLPVVPRKWPPRQFTLHIARELWCPLLAMGVPSGLCALYLKLLVTLPVILLVSTHGLPGWLPLGSHG